MYQILKLQITGIALLLVSFNSFSQWNFTTNYFKIHINNKGFISSMKNTTVLPNHEFCIANQPSPLMSLYDGTKKIYYEPVKASFLKEQKLLKLTYTNGSVAVILIEPQKKYIKLQLQSLTRRNGIEGIQWGYYHTNITNLMGEIIGVARDTSATVNYAIGMMALDDNTLGGASTTIGDAAPFQYFIHSPDTKGFHYLTACMKDRYLAWGEMASAM